MCGSSGVIGSVPPLNPRRDWLLTTLLNKYSVTNSSEKRRKPSLGVATYARNRLQLRAEESYELCDRSCVRFWPIAIIAVEEAMRVNSLRTFLL